MLLPKPPPHWSQCSVVRDEVLCDLRHVAEQVAEGLVTQHREAVDFGKKFICGGLPLLIASDKVATRSMDPHFAGIAGDRKVAKSTSNS